MNHHAQLTGLANLLAKHDLNEAELNIRAGRYGVSVAAYHDSLSATERQNFKRCFGPLTESGEPPYVCLQGWAPITVPGEEQGTDEIIKVRATLDSAFECKITRTVEETSDLSDWTRENYKKQIERMQKALDSGVDVTAKHEYTCESK